MSVFPARMIAGPMIRRGNRPPQQTSCRQLATLKSIHRADLPAGEQLDFDLYLELLETANEGLQYGDDLFPFRNVVPRNLWMP